MWRVYRGLLRLYPAGYIREYGEEMLSVFCSAQEAARRRGLKARAIFCFREVLGVLTGALHAQLHYYDWNPFRRFNMRSDFRFPRTTQVLMTLILVAVVFAIKQGQAIVADANAPENWTAVFMGVWAAVRARIGRLCDLVCTTAFGAAPVLECAYLARAKIAEQSPSPIKERDPRKTGLFFAQYSNSKKFGAEITILPR